MMKLLLLVLVAVVGCGSPHYKRVQGPVADNGDAEIIYYHRCYDRACNSFDVSPEMQAVVCRGEEHRFSASTFEIRDVFLLDDQIFISVWNEYNSFIAKVGNAGGLVFVCDLYGLDHHALRSLDLTFAERDLLVSVEYGFFGEEKAPRKIVKRIAGFRLCPPQ